MGLHTAVGEQRTLRRIVALLVAFAVLAERAAVRSLPIRWLVLCILRRAEAVAAEYVLETTGTPLLAEGVAPAGNGPDDALRLAAQFRALAAALAALLSVACLPGRPARRALAPGLLAPASGRALRSWALEPNDTS